MNGKEKFISIGKASIITGLCPQTLRSLADQSKIACYKTPSGQRRFNIENLEKMCNPSNTMQKESENIKHDYIYARVSSKKQMDDLSRQIDYLKSINGGMYSTYTVVFDIASGINFKRKGLDTILESCSQKTIGKLVIAHRDRLSRFAFELVESIVNKSGGEIIVTDKNKNSTTEQELSEDLLSIIHIYSCRQMGKRSYKKSKIDNKSSNDTDLSNSSTKSEIE